MMHHPPAPPLTNLQHVMLPVFARNLPEEDIQAITQLISDYLLRRVRERAAEVDAERDYTPEDYDRMLNEPS